MTRADSLPRLARDRGERWVVVISNCWRRKQDPITVTRPLPAYRERGRRVIVLFVVALLLNAVGCGTKAQPLPRDDAQVYLLRGYRDWYSTGINDLGRQLQSRGFDAVVLPQSDSGKLGKSLVGRSRSRPLVLIGFSYGANDVIRIARRMAKTGLRVDLLITIDPVTPPRVPANVEACANYYQSNGPADLLPWLRGVPVSCDKNAATPTNFNLRTHRKDLLQADTSHATIAGHEKLHVEIVQRVVGVLAPAGTLSGSKP